MLFADYSLNNPDTLTKYKEAGKISQKVLETVSGMTASQQILRHSAVGVVTTKAD